MYDANGNDDSSSLLEKEAALVDAQYVPNLMDPNSDTRHSILCFSMSGFSMKLSICGTA
jgi:hypothetical protein